MDVLMNASVSLLCDANPHVDPTGHGGAGRFHAVAGIARALGALDHPRRTRFGR